MNFTFHDVSINTGLVADAMKDVQTLHSTMFLLIPGFCVRLRIQKNALHSTMFLLILQAIVDLIKTFSSLHSTMFLLIQSSNLVFSSCRICFTFHDVSINTGQYFNYRRRRSVFTFHDVSINTSKSAPCYMFELTLHSTMFLLIRKSQSMR